MTVACSRIWHLSAVWHSDSVTVSVFPLSEETEWRPAEEQTSSGLTFFCFLLVCSHDSSSCPSSSSLSLTWTSSRSFRAETHNRHVDLTGYTMKPQSLRITVIRSSVQDLRIKLLINALHKLLKQFNWLMGLNKLQLQMNEHVKITCGTDDCSVLKCQMFVMSFFHQLRAFRGKVTLHTLILFSWDVDLGESGRLLPRRQWSAS